MAKSTGKSRSKAKSTSSRRSGGGSASGSRRGSSSSKGGKRNTARPTAGRRARSNSAAAASAMRGARGDASSAGTDTKRRGRGKVGESREAAAKSFPGKGDFGAPETDVRERNYASTTTRNQDPGAMPSHSSGEGVRDTGVGGNESGTGSSSAGDVDTDIVGVGFGGDGVASTGPDERTGGADMVSGDDNPSDTNAAHNPDGGKRRGRARPAVKRRVEGTTIDRSGGDRDTTHSGRGSAAVNDPPESRNDDSFAGEVSNDDAAGADNSASDRM